VAVRLHLERCAVCLVRGFLRVEAGEGRDDPGLLVQAVDRGREGDEVVGHLRHGRVVQADDLLQPVVGLVEGGLGLIRVELRELAGRHEVGDLLPQHVLIVQTDRDVEHEGGGKGFVGRRAVGGGGGMRVSRRGRHVSILHRFSSGSRGPAG